MPYIFLNTIAQISNFHVPTPIILSGESIKECRNIKTKFVKTISNKKCSAYLLSVALAELLDNLEQEGFKTVKIQRNGRHNIWILHKSGNKKVMSSVNLLKQQIKQNNGEKQESNEINENSLSEDISKKPVLEDCENSKRTQQCQTPALISLLGGGDNATILNVQCQCGNGFSNVKNNGKKSSTVNATKNKRDIQNQTSFNQINVTKTDFGCQFDSAINKHPFYDYNHNNIKIDENSIQNEIHSNISLEKKHKTMSEIACDKFINVIKDASTKSSQDNLISDMNSNNSGIKTSYNASVFDFDEVSENKEHFNNKSQDILIKLEKRFQNEHEYFSNVRIKKSKNKESYMKKSMKGRKQDNNSGISLNENNRQRIIDNNNDEPTYCLTENSILSNIDIEGENIETISNSTRVQSVESIHFYEALDSNSLVSIQGSFKTIVNKQVRYKGFEEVDRIDRHNSDSLIQHPVIDSSKKVKQMKRMDRKENIYENSDQSKQISHVKNINNCENVIKRIDSFRRKCSVDINYEKVVKKDSIDTVNHSSKSKIIQKELEILSTNRSNFKSQLSQRTRKTNLDENQTRLLSPLRQKDQQSVQKEPVCSFKETRDLRISRFGRKPISATSNKEKLSGFPLSSKRNKFLRNNLKT